jgi:Sulfotransferase domain
MPDFFIVGAPKSGTSAMDHYLGEHPDIFMARKEMHHFGRDLHFAPKIYRRDLPAYLAEFEGRGDRKLAGEASVWYLFSKEAAGEIRAFNPEAKIIVMLRRPAEMMYSLYHQFRYDDNEDLDTFEEALDAENERRAGRRLSRQTYFPQGLIYRDVARYTDQVQRYFDAFGRARVHVVLYDDFAASPAAACRETLQFLGVDPAALKSDFAVINSAKTVNSTALRSLLRATVLRAVALKMRPVFPRFFGLLQRVESRLQKLNTRYEKSAPLAPELRELLTKQFEPEVDRLGRLLGRDLSDWSRAGRVGAKSLQPSTISSNDHACLVSTGIS